MMTCMHIQLHILYKENSGAANICTYKLDDPAIARVMVLAKMPLLDLLQAFPAKLELVNSVLADASLPPQTRAFMERAKVYTQQHAAYGSRLNYQALFGLDKPVAWDCMEKCAIGFDETAKVCLSLC